MNLKMRKRKIRKIIFNGRYVNTFLIYKLLENEALDSLLLQLDERIVVCPSNPHKKKYLTAEEHFVFLLDNFLCCLKSTFSSLDYSNIEIILNDFLKSKYCKIFLEKHWWGSNEYLREYNLEFKKIIIDSFVSNLFFLDSKIYNNQSIHEMKKIINKDKNEIFEDERAIDDTIELLNDLIVSNSKLVTSVYLFQNIQETIEHHQSSYVQVSQNIMSCWDLLFYNYQQKKPYLDKIQRL